MLSTAGAVAAIAVMAIITNTLLSIFKGAGAFARFSGCAGTSPVRRGCPARR
ncbi:Uncharacterised protein [Flavonifractor plautii]|uniref:Uncharacterized protein n=1 Tax=Flavonifractor plautii TaxID=292800 RepID=A0A174U6N1_FLAPL|nr:Uncharacterised protein [Flavonifractor plautii]